MTSRYAFLKLGSVAMGLLAASAVTLGCAAPVAAPQAPTDSPDDAGAASNLPDAASGAADPNANAGANAGEDADAAEPSNPAAHAGGAVAVCAARSVHTGSMTIAANAAYWISGEQIESCPLDGAGATATTYADFHSNESLATTNVEGLAADGSGGLYYSSYYMLFRFGTAALYEDSSATRSGGSRVDISLSSSWPGKLAADSSSGALFLLEAASVARLTPGTAPTDGGVSDAPYLTGTTLTSLAAGGGRVFAFDSAVPSIVGTSVTSTGALPQATVASGSYLTAVTALATDGTSLFFADASGVYACPADGCGASPAPLAAHPGTVSAIALDDANAYWIGSSGLVSCAKTGCGGAPTVLVSGAKPSAGLGLDAANAYYLQGGTLYRVAKK